MLERLTLLEAHRADADERAEARPPRRAWPRAARGLAWLVRTLVAVGALAFALRGETPQALTLALIIPALLVATRVAASPDLVFTAATSAFMIAVTFGLLNAVPNADLGAHALLAMAAVPVTDGILQRSVPELPRVRRELLLVIVVLGAGVGWEGVEALTDALFGTDFSPGAVDTATDLTADLAGAIAGAALVIWRIGH